MFIKYLTQILVGLMSINCTISRNSKMKMIGSLTMIEIYEIEDNYVSFYNI